MNNKRLADINRRALFFWTIFIVCLGAIAIFTNGVGPSFVRHQAILALLALLFGIVLSAKLEGTLSQPAERLMNLATGFGIKKEDAQFDKHGVPVISLRRLGSVHYNATRVAMAAMDYYKEWRRSGSSQSFNYFKNCADSLVSNMKTQTLCNIPCGIWEHDYPFSYGLRPPWVSGLAQGVAVQILGRAYSATRKEIYRETGELALNTFFAEVKDGGVTYKDGEREWWYEEYASPGASQSRVLNGMVYALLGLQEYYEHTGSEQANILFKRGMASLKRRASSYDAGWWTYYDALGTLATKSYHKVHIDLMGQIYEKTRDEQFLKLSEQWALYRASFFTREFLRQQPSWHDLVVVFLSMGVVAVALEILYAAFFVFL